MMVPYSAVMPVTSPWGGGEAGEFGTGKLLAGVSKWEAGSHSFEYHSTTVNGTAYTTGEMQKVTLPYGATIRWELRDFAFVGNRVTREITDRYLKTLPGGAETRYRFMRDDALSAGLPFHVLVVMDGGDLSHRTWFG